MLKITKKKIIWILHNKHAHKEKSLVVDYLMDIMAIISNKVVVHSSDGIKFFTERFSSESEDKVIYIPHPVYPVNNSYKKNIDKIEWDYIIWGTITERKQLHNLIFKINKGDILKNKRILICGKCSDEDYFNKLSNMLPSNVTLINKFCSDEELSEYIMKSKYILFTYNSSSLLRSCSLIYSLCFN